MVPTTGTPFRNPQFRPPEAESFPAAVAGTSMRPANYSIPNTQINIGAFGVPAKGTFGDLGRNVYRGPAVFNWDFSLFKQFRVKENQRLEFRAEMFNIFNTPQFSGPNGNLLSANFGRSSSTIGAAGGFGSNRQIQFALKYIF